MFAGILPGIQIMAEDKQIVYGRKPVIELIRSGRPVEKIFVQKGLSGPFEIELRNLLKGRDIPVSVVPPIKLDKFTRGTHQGIVAFSAIVEYEEMESLVARVIEKGEMPFFLMLDGVTDVRNFGAIIRSAEVFGAHGIIFSSKNSALINHTMIKTSAGSLFNVALSRVKSLHNAVEYLKSSGLRVLVSSLGAAQPVADMDFTGPVCLVLGSEETGVSAHMEKLADEVFRIPQFGKTDSLNVAVASGVILYEVTRQRSLPG